MAASRFLAPTAKRAIALLLIGYSVTLPSCATHSQRQAHREQISALKSLTPVPAKDNGSQAPSPAPSQHPKDSDLIRALENLSPLSGVRWIKPIRPSIQIQARKGVPPAYALNDLSLSGDLTNARTFMQTHEVIFWLKGSLEFGSFKFPLSRRREPKRQSPELPWTEPTPIPRPGHTSHFAVIRSPYPRKTLPPGDWIELDNRRHV